MFTEIAVNRRSIRNYSARAVEPDKIDAIVEAALRSPSGRGARPWEFVVVTDKELLQKLSVAKPGGAAFLKGAPVGIVVCGDPSKSGLWLEDCAIAAVSLQYAAQSLGLGSRWTHIRGNMHDDGTSSRDYTAGLLGLPDRLDVVCVIAVGYPAEETSPYGKDQLPFDQVSYERYGRKRAG